MAKWLFVFFLFLSTVITICFFWGETKSLSLTNPINHEKFASYFTSIGAVGTALSLFLLYRQVKLANDTNVATYEPDLRFISKAFTVKVFKISDISESKIKVAYYDKNNTQIDINNQLELSNYGNNVALDISFQFRHRRVLFKTSRFNHVFLPTRIVGYKEFIPSLDAQKTVTYPLPRAIDIIMQKAREWFDRDQREWFDRELALGTRIIATHTYILLKYKDKTKKNYIKEVPIYIKLEDKKDSMLFALFFMQG